jgi:putative membrane protein insertion efficiency factor
MTAATISEHSGRLATQSGDSGGSEVSPDRQSRPRPAARAIIALIRLYQAARHGRPSPCRYLPTCSVYAIEALERHGAVRGSLLAARRLARCHPLGGFGVDPVPE